MSEHEIDSTGGVPSVETRTAEQPMVNDGASAAPAGSVAPDDQAADHGSGADGNSTASDSPVAAALAELDTLAGRDVAEHPEVYERIHGQLHAALSAIDDA